MVNFKSAGVKRQPDTRRSHALATLFLLAEADLALFQFHREPFRTLSVMSAEVVKQRLQGIHSQAL